MVQKSAENGSVTYIAYPTESQSIIDEISGALKAASIDVQEIQAERGRLDEVFRRITTAA